jgi:hypothetical protein
MNELSTLSIYLSFICLSALPMLEKSGMDILPLNSTSCFVTFKFRSLAVQIYLLCCAARDFVRWEVSCSNLHEINCFEVMTKSCSVTTQTTKPDNFSSVQDFKHVLLQHFHL